MKAEKVIFNYEQPLKPMEDVHCVFADLIKAAKERITDRVTVELYENDIRKGNIFQVQTVTHTQIELKLTVKIPV